jgi:hypothetical protein
MRPDDDQVSPPEADESWQDEFERRCAVAEARSAATDQERQIAEELRQTMEELREGQSVTTGIGDEDREASSTKGERPRPNRARWSSDS